MRGFAPGVSEKVPELDPDSLFGPQALPNSQLTTVRLIHVRIRRRVAAKNRTHRPQTDRALRGARLALRAPPALYLRTDTCDDRYSG